MGEGYTPQITVISRRLMLRSEWMIKLILFCFVWGRVEPQFRSQQTEDFFNQPYNRPSTARPQNRFSVPNYRSPSDNYDDLYRNKNYHHSDNVRYRGSEYKTNERGGPGYGTRERDRLRLNYNQYNEDNPDLEFRNTIFDRWRPDLQGEKRPGETPGVNLPLAEDVFVSTDSGKIQGFYVYLYDQPGNRPDERPANKPLELQRHVMNVTVFLGIPYAQPPFNEGRFKPPRRVHPWHTTWQAIDFSPACPQNLKYVGASRGIRSGIDEDCLYLNVFTPSLSVNARARYPVLFHIHGGSFDHGSGSQFPGHMLAAWGQVVVVTVNYRLGALGFLSTGDYHSPGNYGLMDMALALEWVHSNIRFFNGDRDRITVFGPGAGGAAAGLLAVLPKTKDWVRQVIAESGSPLADWAAINDPYRVQNTSRVFGLEMGCNVENSYNLLRCLVNRDYEELATAPIIPDVGTFPWSPVVDGNFTVPGDSWYEDWNEVDWHILPTMPIDLYLHNQHHPYLKYLTGVNRDEAADFVFNDIRLSQSNFEVSEPFFDARIRDWVRHYNYTLNPDGAFDAIKWKYTFWPDPKNTTHIREEYINMLSDALYKSGVDRVVKVLINSTEKNPVPTYYYLLNTTVEALKLPLWREVPTNLESYFTSGAPFMDPEFYPERDRVARQQWTEGDRNISQFMMKTFANFAKWGNPTQEQVDPIKVNWEPTTSAALKYLSLNNTFNTSIHFNYRQTEATFWYEYMPLVVREYVPTPPPPRNPWIDMQLPVTATMYGLLAVVVAILVILCVCFGLWKSAKRQRNKALDDLSFYSTENLTLTKDEDYEVRSYLEKLSGLRQPSRSGTLNTLASTEQLTHQSTSSRPITPFTASNSNGKLSSQENLTEPDHQYNQYSTKKPSATTVTTTTTHQNHQQPFNYTSVRKDSALSQDKHVIMELEEPSRVRRGNENRREEPVTCTTTVDTPHYNQRHTKGEPAPYNHHNQEPAPYNHHHNKGFVGPPLGLPELPPYTEPLVHPSSTSTGPSTSSPAQPRRNLTQPQPQPQPHATTTYSQPSYHTTTTYEPPPQFMYDPQVEVHHADLPDPNEDQYQRPVEQSQDQYQRPPRSVDHPPDQYQRPQRPQRSVDTADLYQRQRPVEPADQYADQYADHYPNQSPAEPNGPEPADQYADQYPRSTTPAGSAVTFEISMKPSRSVGTISNASGLILNTEL